MKAILAKGLLVIVFLTLVPSASHAAVITFDDLAAPDATNGNGIPSGYGLTSFHWNNFNVLNTALYTSNCGGCSNGYFNGTQTVPNIAFDPNGSPANITSNVGLTFVPFNFNSAFMHSAWDDGLNINIKGQVWDGTMFQVLYNSDITVNAHGPATLFNFNFNGIHRLQFTPSCVGIACNSVFAHGAGTHFVLDNMEVNADAAPEPASVTLLCIGLAGLVGFTRRRLRKS